MAGLCTFVAVGRGLSFHNWLDVAFAIGAVGCSVAAVIAFLAAVLGWSDERASHIKAAVFIWLAVLPVGAVLLIALGLPVWRWFQTIPSWAAVIIILLGLIYFNMPKRN